MNFLRRLGVHAPEPPSRALVIFESSNEVIAPLGRDVARSMPASSAKLSVPARAGGGCKAWILALSAHRKTRLHIVPRLSRLLFEILVERLRWRCAARKAPSAEASIPKTPPRPTDRRPPSVSAPP